MKVNITKRIELPERGWRFLSLVRNPNGRIKADWVWVNGKEEHHPAQGRYYIDFLENGKRVRIAAGSTLGEALEKADRQEKILVAHKAAAEAGIALVERTATAIAARTLGRPLRDAVKKYLQETKDHKKGTTYNAYRTALMYFLESCRQHTLEGISREDLMQFKMHLKAKGHGDRTIHNQFGHVMIFLKWCGMTVKLGKHDRPKYTSEEPEVYTQKQLDTFFSACTEIDHLWFTFFLETGMRDQEVMHAEWSWVNFERNIITVRENKGFDWRPKMNKGRLIAVPSSLIESLRAWKEKSDPACGLIFPNTNCKPKGDFLAVCKDAATRAKLNPDEFWLHKFRATRITNWLRDGLDLKSVQKLAGHSNLASTSRYLASQEIDILQAQVEAAKNGRK